MGRYKAIAIDQENGICCFPECNNLHQQEKANAEPLIKYGRCCGFCYLDVVMPERKRRIEEHSKEAEENKHLKVELDRVIEYSKHLNGVIFHLQKDIHTLTDELHKTKEERDKDLVYMNKLLEAVSKGEMKLVEHKKKEDFFLSVVGDKEIN
jgi:hypothetical protein